MSNFSRFAQSALYSDFWERTINASRASAAGATVKKISQRARIHHVYYLLAAFDLCAIGGGIYLTHKLTQLYVESVSVNQNWAGHIKDLSTLGNIAQAVDAPGNDIFDSHDVKTERTRQAAAETEFSAQFEMIKRSLSNVESETLSAALTRVGSAKEDMLVEANLIFQYFTNGQESKAGERMATMDRKYGLLTKAISDAAEIMQGLQAEHFAAQLREAQEVRRFEYLGGTMMLLIVGFVAVFGHKISMTLKRANDERQIAAEQLQTVNENVTNLNVELANNILQLKEAQAEVIRKGKMAQLGQLTATVAHEIRNPLGAIKTSAQLVERKVKDKNLGLEKTLERINNGVSRCDHIITELLDFARSKSLQLKTAPIDTWVQATVEEESKNLPAGVEVSFVPGLAGADAAFDPERMRRVIINLFSNAAEAMVGKGNVKVAVVTQNPKIVVSTKMVSGCVELTVKDNGPGISEENLAKILEPLFTTKSFGVGLGLPAIEKILEQHGGGLRIESKPGEGAAFTAWFPAAEAQSKAA